MAGIEYYDSTQKLYTPVGTSTPLPVTSNDVGVPSAATPVNASSASVANAVAAATMPAVASKKNYITGLYVTGAGSTAGGPVTVTLTGVVGGPLNFTYIAAVGATLPNQSLFVPFPTPLAASAVNTAITASCPALGAGNTNNTVVVTGYVI